MFTLRQLYPRIDPKGTWKRDDHTPQGPVDASLTPRYAGIATFAKLPAHRGRSRCRHRCRRCSLEHRCAASAPAHGSGGRTCAKLRACSRPYNPAQDVSPFNVKQVVDAGDIVANPFNLDEAVQQVEDGRDRARREGRQDRHRRRRPHDRPPAAARHQQEARPGCRAPLRRAPRYLGHLLRCAPRRTAPRSAAHRKRRAPSTSPPACTVAPAARSRASRTLRTTRSLASRSSPSEFIEEHGIPAALEKIRARVGDKPLYISIATSTCSIPPMRPGTGTPEAGGLTSPCDAPPDPRSCRPAHRGGRRCRGGTRLRSRADHRNRRRATLCTSSSARWLLATNPRRAHGGMFRETGASPVAFFGGAR